MWSARSLIHIDKNIQMEPINRLSPTDLLRKEIEEIKLENEALKRRISINEDLIAEHKLAIGRLELGATQAELEGAKAAKESLARSVNGASEVRRPAGRPPRAKPVEEPAPAIQQTAPDPPAKKLPEPADVKETPVANASEKPKRRSYTDLPKIDGLDGRFQPAAIMEIIIDAAGGPKTKPDIIREIIPGIEPFAIRGYKSECQRGLNALMNLGLVEELPPNATSGDTSPRYRLKELEVAG